MTCNSLSVIDNFELASLSCCCHYSTLQWYANSKFPKFRFSVQPRHFPRICLFLRLFVCCEISNKYFIDIINHIGKNVCNSVAIVRLCFVHFKLFMRAKCSDWLRQQRVEIDLTHLSQPFVDHFLQSARQHDWIHITLTYIAKSYTK